MALNLSTPSAKENLNPKILVVGIGGAGGNAVNNMISADLDGVEFVAANTDAQALAHSLAQTKIQLGAQVTQGLGAGADPQVGRKAAEEARDELCEALEGCNMVFITAGMGGGTGTGAAPVIAKMARELGILTVGVVTKPFQFEGTRRMKLAEEGLAELQNDVDTLIIIPNQNLFRIANEKTTFSDAFAMADNVLYSGVRGVTDLIVRPGLINLDFADIRAVMSEMGKAMMGTGESSDEKRATVAAEAAIANPLLDDVSMRGAQGVLINITGGSDMKLYEVDEAANRVRDEVDPDANIIFGSTFDDALEGVIRVSIVATGIDAESIQARPSIATKKPMEAGEETPQVLPIDLAGSLSTAKDNDTMDDAPQGALMKQLFHDDEIEVHKPHEDVFSDDSHEQFIPAAPVKPVSEPVDELAKPYQESASGQASMKHSAPGLLDRLRRSLYQRTHETKLADTDNGQLEQATPVLNTTGVADTRVANTRVVDANVDDTIISDTIVSENIDQASKEDNQPKAFGNITQIKQAEPIEQSSPVGTTPRADIDHDLLEIPAFLRRQAN